MLAVDYGTVMYNLQYWDAFRFRWTKDRISMNCRLANAGISLGLERYMNAERFDPDMMSHILPFAPDNLPDYSISSGDFSIKKKAGKMIAEVGKERSHLG
jgi:hypothetical protein